VDEAERGTSTTRPRAVTGPRTRSSGRLLHPEDDIGSLGDVAGLDVVELGCGPHTSRRGSRSAARARSASIDSCAVATARRMQAETGNRVPAPVKRRESVPLLMARSTSPLGYRRVPLGRSREVDPGRRRVCCGAADGSSSSRPVLCTSAHRGRRRHGSSCSPSSGMYRISGRRRRDRVPLAHRRLDQAACASTASSSRRCTSAPGEDALDSRLLRLRHGRLGAQVAARRSG